MDPQKDYSPSTQSIRFAALSAQRTRGKSMKQEETTSAGREPRGLKTAEAARVLGYQKQTLWKWSSGGNGPIQPRRIRGGQIRWMESEVLALLGENA